MSVVGPGRRSRRGAIAGNLATSLKCRSHGAAMDRYDRLPPELRAWLAHAALPWSPRSALKLWKRLCLECGGDGKAICRRFDLAEARLLARDAPGVWVGVRPSGLVPRRPSGLVPRRPPGPIFNDIDGGADNEVTLRRRF